MSKHSAKNAPAADDEKAKAKQQENDVKPAETPDSPEGSKKEATPEEKIADLEIKLAESNDNYLRKAADFENFRKRMNREKQESIEYANQSLLLDLIEVIDDFERALKSGESLASAESEPAIRSFYEGILMIEKRFTSQLENKWGLKRFNSLGEPFDPNFHEAIMMEKSGEIDEPKVQDEYSKGYLLRERVVRHAKVKVLMPEKNASAAQETDENKKTPEQSG